MTVGGFYRQCRAVQSKADPEGNNVKSTKEGVVLVLPALPATSSLLEWKAFRLNGRCPDWVAPPVYFPFLSWSCGNVTLGASANQRQLSTLPTISLLIRSIHCRRDLLKGTLCLHEREKLAGMLREAIRCKHARMSLSSASTSVFMAVDHAIFGFSILAPFPTSRPSSRNTCPTRHRATVPPCYSVRLFQAWPPFDRHHRVHLVGYVGGCPERGAWTELASMGLFGLGLKLRPSARPSGDGRCPSVGSFVNLPVHCLHPNFLAATCPSVRTLG